MDDLPQNYTLLLEKFERMADRTRELYTDYEQGTVTDSQLRTTAEACHDTMQYYYNVCEDEQDCATDEKFPEPVICDDALAAKNLSGLMEMAKRKEGMFQTMIANPDAGMAPNLSMRVSEFMNSSSTTAGNPVLEWVLANTDVQTDHMETMLERLEDM